MSLCDPEFKIRSEQTTYRILIGAIAAVLIVLVACITAGNISYHLAQPPIVPDTPVSRVQVKGDRPQRYEFVDADGRVITSIVVQP